MVSYELCNNVLRLMVMVCNCLGKRLWKWKGTVWATAYGNGKQPLMEMVANRFV
jgi:hypothetical protein